MKFTNLDFDCSAIIMFDSDGGDTSGINVDGAE